jgi:hypothetical protein
MIAFLLGFAGTSKLNVRLRQLSIATPLLLGVDNLSHFALLNAIRLGFLERCRFYRRWICRHDGAAVRDSIGVLPERHDAGWSATRKEYGQRYPIDFHNYPFELKHWQLTLVAWPVGKSNRSLLF